MDIGSRYIDNRYRAAPLIERRPVVWLSGGMTVLGLVTFPAQDLPVLIDADLAWIGLCLCALATGVAATSGRGSRRRNVVASTVMAVVIALGAVAGYKLFAHGAGWPDWHHLALGPLAVALASLAGSVARRLVLRTVVALGVLVATTAFFAWAPSALAPRHTLADQTCVRHRGVRYCANPGYEGLIPYWRRTADAVLGRVPRDVAAQATLIAQDAEGPPPRGSIATPSGGWTRPGSRNGSAELVLGLDVADWATGIHLEDGRACAVAGQARAIVAMWLAGMVSADARRLAANLDPFADSITGSYAEAIHGGPIAGHYAGQLFRRPDGEVGRIVRANWTALVDPNATYRDAERVLGLRPVEPTATEARVATEDASRTPAACA